jgi:EmrB/QacA subfamily drug resistance transporter
MNMTVGGPPARKSLEPKWLILTAVMLGTFMSPLDGSIVNTILPSITTSFRTEISIVQWVPTVYLLTTCCLILLYGRLGDIIGHKRVFLYGIAGFTITSILCGSSQSIWMLIAFRALQGLAGSMILAVGLAIVTAAFPSTERGKAMGIYAIGIAIGLGLGPTLGGLITEYLSWRYVFFINVPIGIAALLWGSRVIPLGRRNPGQRLDWYGALTALVFLLGLLLYANRGEDWGWASPLSLVPLAVAVVFGALFFWIERTSAQPMLNLALFANHKFSFASLSALFSFMALYTLIFVTPFYLAFVLHYSILKVGLVMIASPVVTLFIAPSSGVLSDRIGTRVLAVCGMFIAALGLFLLSRLQQSAQAFDVIWRLAVTGLGMGMFQSPNNSAIMGSVPPRHLGISSGVLAAMRNVGMVLGIAVAGAVLYNMAPVAASMRPGSFTGSQIQEFLSGLHWSYIAGAVLAAASALTSLLAVSPPAGLSRELASESRAEHGPPPDD